MTENPPKSRNRIGVSTDLVSPVFSLIGNGIVCASVPITDGSGCADDQRARPLEVPSESGSSIYKRYIQIPRNSPLLPLSRPLGDGSLFASEIYRFGHTGWKPKGEGVWGVGVTANTFPHNHEGKKHWTEPRLTSVRSGRASAPGTALSRLLGRGSLFASEIDRFRGSQYGDTFTLYVVQSVRVHPEHQKSMLDRSLSMSRY